MTPEGHPENLSPNDRMGAWLATDGKWHVFDAEIMRPLCGVDATLDEDPPSDAAETLRDEDVCIPCIQAAYNGLIIRGLVP